MLSLLTFIVVWLGGALGGLALFNFLVAKEEGEERNLFFNDDVEDMTPAFFLFGPFSLLLIAIAFVCIKATAYLSKFKVGG